MSYIRGLSGFQGVVVAVILDVSHVYGKDCYNYREEPRVRDCTQGCCGEQYEQYCCDSTMQIVGCVLGGLLIIGAIIGVAYFCYRSKSKQGRLVHVPGVLGRLGLRSNHNQISAHAQQTNRRPPRLPTGRHPQLNSSYNPAYVNSVDMQCRQPPGYYPPTYASNTHDMPMAPTAPMPPPYEMTIAPPPYAHSKNVPPPPTYNSIVSHMTTPGFKAGVYSDNMPAPTD